MPNRFIQTFEQVGKDIAELRRAVPLSRYAEEGDANFTTGGGTDNTAAIDNWLSYLTTNKVAGYVDGFYRYVGQLNVPEGVTILTSGADKAGFLIEINATQSCFVCEQSNVNIDDLTICRNLIEEKTGADSGHLGNAFRLGNYLNGVQTAMERMSFGRVRLIDVPGSFSSPAVGIYGYVQEVFIQHLEIQPSIPGKFSLGIQAHWSGDITAIGQTVTESYHPNNIHIGRIDCHDCNVAVTLSAVGNITIDEVFGLNNGRGFYWLSGDEVDNYSVHEAGIVGRNVHIGNMTFIGSRNSSGNFSQLVGHGTSKFKLDADGNLEQKNLEMDIKIDKWVQVGDGNTPEGLSLVNCTGRVEIGQLELRGSTTYSIYANRSNAHLKIGQGLFGEEVRLFHSKNIEINGEFVGNKIYAGYIFGSTEDKTLATSASVGATSILLSSGIGKDVLKGDIFRFGEVMIRASQFANTGALTIPVEPLTVAISSGSTVTHDTTEGRCVIKPVVKGSYENGFRVLNKQCSFIDPVIEGCTSKAFQLTDAQVDLRNPILKGIGDDLAVTIYAITAADTHLNIHGGSLGEEEHFVDETLYVTGTSKVNVFGALFGSVAKADSTAGTATLNFFGCFDKAGNAVT